MPPGAQPMTAAVVPDLGTSQPLREWGPFAPQPLAAHIPIAGEMRYRLDADRAAMNNGRFATESTHVHVV